MVYKIYNNTVPVRDLRFYIADRQITLYKENATLPNAVDLEANSLLTVNGKQYLVNFSRNEILGSRHLRQLVDRGDIVVDTATISTPPEEAVHVIP